MWSSTSVKKCRARSNFPSWKGRKVDISRRSVLNVGLSGVVASTSTNPIPATALSQSVIADPTEFPGIDPRGTSDSHAGLQRAMDQVPPGGVFEIPPGNYLVSGTLRNRDRAIHIVGYGATLIQSGDNPTLLLARPWRDTQRVVSINQGSITVSDGNATPCVRLDLSAVPSWPVGSVVKVFSDDEIPGARPGTANRASRRGQFLSVHSIDGTRVTLAGSLIDPLINNVRVSRLSEGTVTISGLTLSSNRSARPSARELCIMESILTPIIRDVSILFAPTAAINITSCYGYSFSNLAIQYASNAPAEQAFGYGVIDNAGFMGRINGMTAANVRHAYTDDTPQVLPNHSSPSQYGRTVGNRISNSSCHGATTAAFDTHSSSVDVSFANCYASGSSIAFTLRGMSHAITNCEAVDCGTGIQVVTESTGADSHSHQVDGFVARNMRGSAYRHHVRPDGHPLAGTVDPRPSHVRNVSIVNARADSIYIRNATVRMENIDISVDKEVADGSRFMHCNNSRVYARSLSLDMRSNESGSAMDLMTFDGPPETVVDVETCMLELSSSTRERIRHLAVAGSEVTLRIQELRLSGQLTSISNQLAAGSYVNWSTFGDTHTSHTITANRWEIEQWYVADAVKRTSRPQIMIFCDPANVIRTLVALPSALFPGQQITVFNYGTTTPIRVRNGAQYGVMTASRLDVLVEQKRSILLVAMPDGRWHEIRG